MFGDAGIIGQGSLDNTVPIVGTLTFNNITINSVDLTCAATDNIGVYSFKIYVDGEYSGRVITDDLVNYTLAGLTGPINYDIYVTAIDYTGNESDPSNTINITTLDPSPNEFIYILTNSTSTTWSPTEITNSGDTLYWEVTGGVTIVEQQIDIPTFNLSQNTGTATIAIRSQSNFSGFTSIRLDNLGIISTDISAAMALTQFSCKLNPNYSIVDVSALVNLTSLTLRSNGLSTIDISNNILLTEIWAYSNLLTSFNITNNPLITFIRIDNNNLDVIAQEKIIIDADSGGLSNGFIYILNNTGTITSTVYTEYQSLITKGWFLDVASPIDPAPDTEDPIIGALTYSNITQTSVELTVTATDNIGVVSYDIYKNTVFSENVIATSLVNYPLQNLDSNADYDIYTVAKDTAGNNSLDSNIISITTDADITLGEFPVLNNFRIENNWPNRIYFDSSESITGTVFSGFIISGKILSNLYIAPSLLTGHYLTITTDFTFWDNNTIRYVGGGDIIDDNSNSLYNFTLQYINNYITEPVPSVLKYASPNGSGAMDGSSQTDEWTLELAAANVTAGDKVYLRKGTYTPNDINFLVDGTATNPIWFEGYDINPGDNPLLGFDYPTTITFDANVMPLWEGGGTISRSMLAKGDYTFFKNIQSQNYIDQTFYASSGIRQLTFDNVYAYNSDYGIFVNTPSCYNTRVLNSFVHEMSTKGIHVGIDTYYTSWVDGGFNMIDSCKVYDGAYVSNAMDYYIKINNKNNIVRNCHVERARETVHFGHGYTVKGDEIPTEYNLIEDCTAKNIKGSIEARHSEVAYNVFRNINIINDNAAVSQKSSISVSTGANNNSFEGITVEGGSYFVRFTSSDEQPNQPGEHHNKFINCTARNIGNFIESEDVNATNTTDINNNEFINCTVYNVDYLVGIIKVNIDSTNKITNCNFDNVTNLGPYSGTATYDFVYDYNNFWNGLTPQGTNYVTVNPTYSVFPNPTNILLKAGLTVSNANYDINNVQRENPPTIGAVELILTPKPIIYNFRIEDSNLDRILFDSTEDITGLTTQGFIISGKPLTYTIFINGTSTTGHYLLLNAGEDDFTFWDNNTIRVESGDGTVYDFTLQYIQNNISEPSSTEPYVYVADNATGTGIGTIGDPYTMEQAAANVIAGSYVAIKAGNYDDVSAVLFTTNGTATNPIKLIGYKTTPDDISGHSWYSEGDAFDTTEMPLFKGDNTTDLYPFRLLGDYVILKNVMSENYEHCINISTSPTGKVLDNILVRSTTTYSGYGFKNDSDSGTNIRYTNCVSHSTHNTGFEIRGSHNLVMNCYTYDEPLTNPSKTDYPMRINGVNNIIINNRIETITAEVSRSAHGISLKASAIDTEYTLIQGNEIINLKGALEARHTQTKNNVFKDNEIYANSVGDTGGIVIQDGASANIFENNYIHDTGEFVRWYESSEDGGSGVQGFDNIFRNNIGADLSTLIYNGRFDADPTNDASGNKFYNNTFSNITYLFGALLFSFDNTNLFTNNIFNNIQNLQNGGAGTQAFVFDYTDIWTSWVTSIGTNSINENPSFVNTIDFVPQNLLLNAGVIITDLDYDITGEERSKSVIITKKLTIGAVEINK